VSTGHLTSLLCEGGVHTNGDISNSRVGLTGFELATTLLRKADAQTKLRYSPKYAINYQAAVTITVELVETR
jgi:hypothetical protein